MPVRLGRRCAASPVAQRPSRSVLRVVVAMMLVSTGAVGFAQPAGAAGTAPGYFVGVACPGATSCFAVGNYFAAQSNRRTLVEHWNGTSWSIMPSPNTTTAANSGTLFDGVACANTANCFAVGATQLATGSQRTLVERWNGTTWSIVASPNPAGATRAELQSVSCPSISSCVAVGHSGAGTFRTLVEHWNGTKWSIVASPNPAGATNTSLFGVTCPSPSSCFAVGNSDDPAHKAVIEHWNGSAWSIMASPNVAGGTITTLRAVACKSATRCFAVGEDEGGSATTTFVELWNGTRWSILSSPNPTDATESGLQSVTCSSSATCFSVGTAGFDFSTTTKTLIERWNGTTWSILASPSPDPSANDLTGVACASTKPCFAVGAKGSATLIERWNGTRWAQTAHPQPSV